MYFLRYKIFCQMQGFDSVEESYQKTDYCHGKICYNNHIRKTSGGEAGNRTKEKGVIIWKRN